MIALSPLRPSALVAALVITASPAVADAQTVLSSDGVRIAYESAGRGDTALVFVHGWACDRTYWAAQMPEFSKTYRVVAIDLAGYGESGRNRTDVSFQAFGQDVAAVIDALKLRNVIVVGHSAGAYA